VHFSGSQEKSYTVNPTYIWQASQEEDALVQLLVHDSTSTKQIINEMIMNIDNIVLYSRQVSIYKAINTIFEWQTAFLRQEKSRPETHIKF